MKITFSMTLLVMIFVTDVEARTIAYCMSSKGAYAAYQADILGLIDEPNDQYKSVARKDCYKDKAPDDLVIKKERVAVVYGEKLIAYFVDLNSYKLVKITKHIADGYQHEKRVLTDFYVNELAWADESEYWAAVAEAKRKAAQWKGLPLSDVDTTALAAAKRGAKAYNRSDHDTAIRYYTDAIGSGELSGGPLANAYYYRGKAWSDKGNLDRALSDYNEVIAIDSQHTGAFHQLAWLYATQKNPKYQNGNLAVRFAEELLKLANPVYPPFIDTVAAAYARGGDFPRATQYQKQAIELAKENQGTELPDYQERLQLYQSDRAYTATD